MICPLLANLLAFVGWMEKVVTRSNRMYSRQSRNSTPEEKMNFKKSVTTDEYPALGIKFVWNHEILLIEVNRQNYLVPKAILLMYHNKACDLISVLLLSLNNDGRQYRIGCTEVVLDLIKELCTLQCQYKKTYFDIVKTLEAFGVTETLIEKENWENTEFLTSLVEDLYDSTGYDYSGSDLQMILKNVDAPFRHELMCLSKITGHPHVDMDKGSRALWQKSNEQYKINLNLVNKCTNYIKRS